MEFHYLSDMKAKQFVESGDPLLMKNASADEMAQIKGKKDTINDMYKDVKKGDRYSLSYMPGTGTELSLNGKVLGLIKGYDFAAVYYRIWLGESPVDKDLKNKLLNNTGQIFSSKQITLASRYSSDEVKRNRKALTFKESKHHDESADR